MAAMHILKVSRLEGLTDGVFAIAMTIMVLNLHVPTELSVDNIFPLIKKDVFLNLFVYAGSFSILGTHWIAMNFQWGLLDHLNRVYLWTNMFYLMVICVVPFSANLLGAYPHQVDSIYFYVINLLFASLGQFVTLKCAHHYKLFKEVYTPAIYRAAWQRMLLAPSCYICALMMAHWNMTLAFILLVAPTLIYMKPGRIDRYETK